MLARETRAAAWLRAALLLSLLGPALLLVFVGWSSHRQAEAEARARLTRLAQIAQEQAQRIVETNEVISRAVLSRTQGQSNAALHAQSAELHGQLAALVKNLPQLQSVWLWDEAGRPIATNLRPDPPPSLDVSDREYFIASRDAPGRSWFVSAPLRSRTTGELFFDFTQRRNGPDGQFAGVLSVSLLPAYFREFFSKQLGDEPGLTLSLFRADGTIIARYPEPPQGSHLGDASPLLAAMQRGDAAGSHGGVSSIDGQPRWVSFRRVGTLPLYAAATGRQDLLLAPWRMRTWVLAAFTLPLALCLAGLCWFALRGARREHAIALAHEQQYEQRLRAEEALRQAQKMEALGRLTGGVAHDFNNVLMVVQANVALARKLQERGRPVDQALAPMDRAVAAGAQLTRQLLAIARRQPLQLRSVQLQDLLPAVGTLMTSTLGRDLAIEVEVAPDTLPVTVDEAELELALINLCLNARDAIAGGGRIRIVAGPAAAPEDAPGGPAGLPWVRVAVEDTGEGIAPELLARVTEPFFTTKPIGKGTGLGLSQVQTFVQQCGGRLQIHSEPGQGTTVALLLPASRREGVAAVRGAPAAPGALHARVMLVEDNEDIASSLQAILESTGATVSRFGSAEAALAALVAQPVLPQVVISDISLGTGMTGIDLARELAQRAPALPVLLMTGYTDRLQDAVSLGLKVLAKPVPPERLVQALQDALPHHGLAAAGATAG